MTLACLIKSLRSRTSLGVLAGVGVGAVGGYLVGRLMRSPKKKLALPATSWPNGKPVYTEEKAYPEWDMDKEHESFMAVGEMLIEEMCSELPGLYEMPPRETEWIRRCLNYNVKGGKMNRGKMVVESIKTLYKHMGRELSPREISRFAVLGWCVEWMQAWLLMLDDVMDGSKTRRGQPCWYKNDDVQLIALNDALTVEALMYKILKRHFGQEEYYLPLLDLFLETTFQTECGQLLDTLCMNLTLDDFTVDRWTLIVKYKTAFYSFYISVAIGMLIVGITDQRAYDAARDVLVTMGVYFQAQDDFLDCFGTPEQIGKIGTDIQDKKCGWLFCQAYHKLANSEQKALLAENYGFDEEGKVAEVKKLYTALDLEKLYRAYEEESYKEIMSARPKIESLNLPWAMFEIFLMKVYKRNK